MIFKLLCCKAYSLFSDLTVPQTFCFKLRPKITDCSYDYQGKLEYYFKILIFSLILNSNKRIMGCIILIVQVIFTKKRYVLNKMTEIFLKK